MDEKEAIQDIVRSREESKRFFSNSNKFKREIWVAKEFLRNLGINYKDDELKPLSNDPPDIIFRDAKFEIKEVDEEKRKRHDEYKQKLEKAKYATSLKDLIRPYRFKEITLQEALNRVRKKLKELIYDPNFCQKTDILFYINYSLIGKHYYTISEKDMWGHWRSISIVANNNISCVFWATNAAPEFIRSITGKVLIRNVN